MLIKKVFFLLLLALSLQGCVFKPKGKTRESYLLELIARHEINKFAKSHQLWRMKFWYGSSSRKFTDIHVPFATDRLLEKDELRNLVISFNSELLEQLNSNIELMHLMEGKPFTQEFVEVSIVSKVGTRKDYKFISQARLSNGCIIYHNDETTKESLSEALAIYKDRDPELIQN